MIVIAICNILWIYQKCHTMQCINSQVIFSSCFFFCLHWEKQARNKKKQVKFRLDKNEFCTNQMMSRHCSPTSHSGSKSMVLCSPFELLFVICFILSTTQIIQKYETQIKNLFLLIPVFLIRWVFEANNSKRNIFLVYLTNTESFSCQYFSFYVRLKWTNVTWWESIHRNILRTVAQKENTCEDCRHTLDGQGSPAYRVVCLYWQRPETFSVSVLYINHIHLWERSLTGVTGKYSAVIKVTLTM